jgi:CRP/FNR family transcriptional regulator, cyclic AMP receptor protein
MADHYPLDRIPLFRQLPPEQIQTLQEAAQPRPFREGETIFTQGEAAEALYIVDSGRVDIVLPAEGGEIVLASFAAGSFFGELGLFDQQPRNATARAASDAALIRIPAQAILGLIDRYPSAARHFLRVVTQRLRGADELLSRIQTRNPNDAVEESLTFGQRVADAVSRFGGSWTFIIAFCVFLLFWMAVNTTWLLRKPADPFPYIFLNLMLSMIAALQAPVIMMSQNRQNLQDRLRAELDYKVNIKAEIAIQQLHRKVDELRALVLQ